MLYTALVQTNAELAQIHALNVRNLKQNLSAAERSEQGFVTWLYHPHLLEQMHQLAPSIVVKDGNTVVGYALVTLKEAAPFHPDLAAMFHYLALLQYKQQPLLSHNFYCMGQVCIDKKYRGIGVLGMLYAGHRFHYGQRFNLLVTEISTRNRRSQRAHEKIGFTTIHTYTDKVDEWNVVVWDWQEKKQKEKSMKQEIINNEALLKLLEQARQEGGNTALFVENSGLGNENGTITGIRGEGDNSIVEINGSKSFPISSIMAVNGVFRTGFSTC